MKLLLFSKFKSIYAKLILSFSIIVVLLSFILSSVLYLNFEKSALDIVYESNVKLLSQISYSADYMNDLGKNYCSSTFLNNDVIAMMFNNSEEIWKMGSSLRKLDITSIPSSYIHSLYIYNRSLDMYMSTATNSFYDSGNFYDKEIVGILSNVKNNDENLSLVPIPRRITTGKSENSNTIYTNVYTYLMYDTSNKPIKVEGATILNIREDWLRNTIASIYSNTLDKESSIFVLDKKGIIVSHSSSEMFLRNVSSEDYIKRLLSSNKNSGFFIDEINNKKFVVTYVTSGVLNWKFISLTPYQIVASTVQKVRWTTIVFCISILLLGLIFSVMLSKKIYTPIGTLVKNVKYKFPLLTSNRKNNSEISFLYNAFEQVIDKADALEDLKRNSMQTLKNDFLKSLLMGNCTISPENLNSKLTEFNLKLCQEDKILLCILKVDNHKFFMENHNETDRILYKFAIANISCEVIGQYFKNEAVDMGNDHICILVNIESDSKQINSGFNKTIRTCILEIQKYIQNYFQLSLSAAVGYITEDLYKVNTSYMETLNISLYRIKFGHGSITSPEDLNEINDDNFVFPVNKEKLLLDSIKLANFEKAKETYNDIIAMLSTCSYDNIVSSLHYITFIIYNCISSIEKISSYKFSTDFNTFNRQISNLETLEQINEMFVRLFDEIINNLNENKGKNSEKIVNNIIEIVKSNYHDKNLCLNSIASSMKMSPIYLGKLFKDATSKSVSEYITEMRLKKVKHLIDTTSLTVGEILEKAGFEKTTYFYTTFKKYFGVSLSEYKLTKAELR